MANHDPAPYRRKFICDLLLGLEWIHSKSRVHCDIKPGKSQPSFSSFLIENIFVSQYEGQFYLQIGDYGAMVSQGDKANHDAGDGNYLAPERLEDDSIATTSIDIYSLGVTLYAMHLRRGVRRCEKVV